MSRGEIRSDDVKEYLHRVPPLPSLLVSKLSSKERQQEKLRYQERAREDLNFFLATPPATREFGPTSPEITKTILALLDQVPLPKKREWKRLKHQAAAACSYLVTINATDGHKEVERHVTGIQEVTKEVSKDYTVFLWLVSMIGMAGTYRFRRPGPVHTGGRRATVQSWPEFRAKPFSRKETEAPSDEQGVQGIKAESNEVEAASRADEKFALNLLPFLFHINPGFFLQQPWVIELLAGWHDNGEEFYLQHAFSGTTEKQRERHQEELQEDLRKKHVGLKKQTAQQSYGQLLKERRRNEKSTTAAHWLIKVKGIKKAAAFKLLGAQKEGGSSRAIVGENNEVSATTVKQKYYWAQKGYDPRLLRLFKW
jgi:hypothetical protein